MTLYSKEGAKLSEVCLKDSWIWSSACHGDTDLLAIGTQSGHIEVTRLRFEAVHSLYRDRYAYRENLTEVIVHHLVTEKRVRIKCKDLIRNLALYKNKLAVQLSDRVCIYESNAEDSMDMHFRLNGKGKIMLKDSREESTPSDGIRNDFNLMTITSMNLVFCVENVLELYSFDGLRQKVWVLDAPAKCIRGDGGPEGHEAIILGLASGSIIKVFVDNPFPMELTKRSHGVVQLDINLYRTVVLSVDSNNLLNITDLQTQNVMFSAPNVKSASFNTEVEDLICIASLDNSISVLSGVKSPLSGSSDDSGSTRKIPPELQEQHIYGIALGFRGQKIYCVHRGTITSMDVPQGVNMQRALDNDDYTVAYKIASLGVTEADWKLLAMRSLRANQISIAKRAFSRLKDIKFLGLIDAIERKAAASKAAAPTDTKVGVVGRNRSSVANTLSAVVGPASKVTSPLDPQWVAELLAYEGHHQEAAKVYARAGKLDQAIRLFTDLRRWDDAKLFARNAGMANVDELTVQQAKWLQEINDWKGSAELLTSMGSFLAAAKIVGESGEEGWEDALLEVVRACPVDDLETLTYCGERFSNLNDTKYAKEAYTKARDISKLMSLYAKRLKWNEAAKLAEENEGKFDVSVFLPYAEWLVAHDRYDEAMQAFKKSDRADLARKVLEELTNNAVAESRFKDAAYYFWQLSKESEQEALIRASNNEIDELIGAVRMDDDHVDHELLQYEYELKADLYFAYANIHSFVTDPFTSQQPEMLFQVARFIINSLGTSEIIPFGISKAATLYTLARQSMMLGAFKLARHAYDRLSKLQLTERRLEEVEIDMLLVQAKPMRDDPLHLPVCYRCGSTNPLLNPFTNKFSKGDVCTNCGHPFVRSFINFDILPLVEFVPEPTISDDEAIELIRQPPAVRSAFGANKTGGRRSASGWKETKNSGKSGGADMMVLDNGSKYSRDDDDALHEAMGINADEYDLFTRCLNITLEKQVRLAVTALSQRFQLFLMNNSSLRRKEHIHQ